MRSLERQLISAELKQRSEEGCDVKDISKRVEIALTEKVSDAEIFALYEELISLPVDHCFPYLEPSSLEEIKQQRPDAPRELGFEENEAALFDRIYGGWLGRSVGCALGKPVEGWSKDRIDKLLLETDTLELDDYIPFKEGWIREGLRTSTRGNIEFMDRDDDMDFTILGLLALERYGVRFNSQAMAKNWMENIPFGMVCTAEYAAYRNFSMNKLPPESAVYRNPFREWIGAQIRADVFGYVTPGYPEKAAELAFHDASISHHKNGIYGEMFVAAMIAAAFVHTSAASILAAGLAEIPSNSRLAEAIRKTIAWCEEGLEWVHVWEKINETFGHYDSVHTINNAALVVMGVWYGEKDFEAGIVNVVRSGWDTDCTAATVGSILGVRLGAKALPKKWVGVLNDRLKSAVTGHSDNKLSDLAQRTVLVSKTLLNPKEDRKESNLDDHPGGVWDLTCEWGKNTLDFEEGTIDFSDSARGVEATPVRLRSCEYNHPHINFSYGVDKGSWEQRLDFEGTVNGDTLKGFYNPGILPVTGRRLERNKGN